MRLSIVVKQKEERVIELDKVDSYYFDKHYLIAKVDGKKNWYKSTTVLSVEEK